MWDIGAGSGSVAIEAAQIASGGTVYAIEMDPEDHALITANAERFGVANLVAVLGRAPEAWSDCPTPTRSSSAAAAARSAALVELAYERLRPAGGWWPTSAASKACRPCTKRCKRLAGDVNVWMINIARGNDQLERVRFEALNPTFLLGDRQGRRQRSAASA